MKFSEKKLSALFTPTSKKLLITISVLYGIFMKHPKDLTRDKFKNIQGVT